MPIHPFDGVFPNRLKLKGTRGVLGIFSLKSASGCGVCWWVANTSPSSAFSDLSCVLRALLGQIGLWHGVLGGALVLLVYRRVSSVCAQMERLVGRFEAGTLRAGVASGARAARDLGARGAATRVWPGGFAWLVRLVGWRAAGFGCQLRAILERPDMAALLEAAPQARRLLRPVCRMLAVETSLLRPPGVTKVVKEDGVAPVPRVGATARIRAPRVAEDWGRIPLPRGVLAAARRQGFGRRRTDFDAGG
jgi:hypothetical protein